MRILTRRLGEGLIIGDNIKITVEKISKSQIKISIVAPRGVVACKEEVVLIMSNQNEKMVCILR